MFFLRCHSEGNDPSDEVTKVWRCAFEPSIEDPGNYKNLKKKVMLTSSLELKNELSAVIEC